MSLTNFSTSPFIAFVSLLILKLLPRHLTDLHYHLSQLVFRPTRDRQRKAKKGKQKSGRESFYVARHKPMRGLWACVPILCQSAI
jgi:hypothetical protein